MKTKTHINKFGQPVNIVQLEEGIEIPFGWMPPSEFDGREMTYEEVKESVRKFHQMTKEFYANRDPDDDCPF